MAERGPDLEAALAARTREELLEALGPRRAPLALADQLRLARKLESFAAGLPTLRTALLRTVASEPLAPFLRFESLYRGLQLELYEGPYGVVHQEAAPGSGLEAHAPELTLVLARAEDLAPAWQGSGALLAPEELAERVAASVDAIGATLAALRERVGGWIVLSLLPSLEPPELGLADAMAPGSGLAARQALVGALAERLRNGSGGVFLDDQQALALEAGRARLFDPRLWHTSRYPYTREGSQLVARRLLVYAVRRLTPAAKCIVLDADNTLWGGIVGEDGPEGIALGPQYPGSAFVAWQERLLAFRRRGILLALCSKNDEAAVLEVLEHHPHQRLRREHFAALRVNWEPKPANLAELARELGLGLDSFVFVDDSPHECLAVRAAHPSVRVVQAPRSPLELVGCLDDEPRLEVLALTDEDRRRAAMYGEERRRRELAAVSSPEDYLRSLEMEMSVSVDEPAHLARVAQLTQKTNQFNLTTRRHDEARIAAWMEADDAHVFDFSLSDVFGDSGLVGVAITRRGAGDGPQDSPASAEIDTFLMSCRVIGRGAETAFLRAVLDHLAAEGVETVRASYAATPRNALVADFWLENAFEELGEGRYEMQLSRRDELQRPPIRVRS